MKGHTKREGECMKRSIVIARIDLGLVLDQTVMSHEEVGELLKIMDLNDFDITPTLHILEDIDTGDVVSMQNLKTGVTLIERHEKGDQ